MPLLCLALGLGMVTAARAQAHTGVVGVPGVAGVGPAVDGSGVNASGMNSGLSQDQMLQQLRQMVGRALEAVQRQQPKVKLSVELGTIDSRLKLAACSEVEPYLPQATRLWGSVRLGLRCLQGPVRWHVFVPATVRAHAQALVAGAALPSGHVLGESDLQLAEVDLAESSSPALTDAALAIGRSLQSPLQSGQTLRAAHLKARQWFAAGETVQLVARGKGFSITTEGTALSPGIDGQTVRVRTEAGRVVTGSAAGNRRVDILM